MVRATGTRNGPSMGSPPSESIRKYAATSTVLGGGSMGERPRVRISIVAISPPLIMASGRWVPSAYPRVIPFLAMTLM